MYRLTMIVALMSFWLIWQNTVNAEEEGKDGESKIFISGDRKAVKGFPVIVKIRARGPLLAPKITLFDETAEISRLFHSDLSATKISDFENHFLF